MLNDFKCRCPVYLACGYTDLRKGIDGLAGMVQREFQMSEIGKEVRRTLKIIPVQVSIREDWYYTCACRTCQNEGTETPVVKAEKTPSVIGSFASPEAVAHIMVQKFCMGPCTARSRSGRA